MSWLSPGEQRRGLQQYVETVRERSRLILSVVLVTSLSALAYVTLAPRVYTAEADLLISPVSGNNSDLVGLGLVTATSDPTQDILTASKLVGSPAVARRVSRQLGLHASPAALLDKVDISPVAQSSVVAISARASSPAKAQALANAFARQTIADRSAALRQTLDRVLPALRQTTARRPLADRVGPGSMGAHLATLQTLRAAGDPTVRIASQAERPERPSSPRVKLGLAGGLIAGLILGLAAAFGLQSLDRRLRREDQLRELYRIPLLARIPRQRKRRGPIAPDELTSVGTGAYRMLRATVTAARNGHKGGRVVVVAGSSPSEGKTTTAVNLACSLSASGHEVVLIDADFLSPAVGDALGVSAPHGLTSVLSGEVALVDALVWTHAYGPQLEMLLVDRQGPHAADELTPPAVRALIDQARTLADYVIIDSPPFTEVIDVLPLIQQADDVIVVARLGVSKLNKLADLGELLIRHDVRPIGVALVGVERDVAPGYGYGPVTASAHDHGLFVRVRDPARRGPTATPIA